VFEDRGIRAAGFFQGIGQDGQAVEGSVVVDAFGEGVHGRRLPRGVERDGAKRIAEDATTKSHCHSMHGAQVSSRLRNPGKTVPSINRTLPGVVLVALPNLAIATTPC